MTFLVVVAAIVSVVIGLAVLIMVAREVYYLLKKKPSVGVSGILIYFCVFASPVHSLYLECTTTKGAGEKEWIVTLLVTLFLGLLAAVFVRPTSKSTQ